MRRFHVVLIVLTCWATLSSPAHAVVLGVTVSPTTRDVNLANGSPITITWTISRSPSAGPITVRSAPADFKIAGVPVAQSRTINRRFSNGITATLVRITETVVVPQSVIARAWKNNAVLEYERTFEDDGVTFLSDEVLLSITGGGSGALGVSRQSISFEDGSTYRSAGLNEELHAVADLYVTGGGVLRAVWEVADESGTTANPFWRRIKNVTRPAGGNPNVTIVSPALPTASLGRLRVRLRMVDPQTETEAPIPVLNYFVTADASSTSELPPFKPEVPAKDGGGLKPQH